MRRRLPGALAAVLVFVAAGATALATDSGERVAACEDRCEERWEECESKAEAAANECVRAIESDPEWTSCACDEAIDGKRGDRCQKVCAKAGKAATTCEKKLEKALERCEERQETCSGKCND